MSERVDLAAIYPAITTAKSFMPASACVARYRLRPVFCLIFSVVLCLPATPTWSAFITRLSAVQIGDVLQLHFPLREYATFARMSFYPPEVFLTKDANDLELKFPVMANVPGDALYRGYALVAVNVSYKPGTGGLYLYRPRLQTVDMSGLPADMADEVRIVVDTVMQNALPLVKIYQVRERDLNHTLSKSELKSMVLEEGGLVLEFGFD